MLIEIENIRYRIQLPGRFCKDPEASRIANWLGANLVSSNPLVAIRDDKPYLYFTLQLSSYERAPMYLESIEKKMRAAFNF